MHRRLLVPVVALLVLPAIVHCGGGGDDAAPGSTAGSAGASGGAQAGASGKAAAGASGTAGKGTSGSGTAGSGTSGSGTAGSGTAGSGTSGSGTAGSGTSGSGTAGSGTAGSGTSGSGTAGSTNPGDGPPAGNPDGKCAIPADAQPASIANPKSVIGDGTKASCTSKAVVDAVAKGGVITFDCGPDPVTIVMEETAKIVNDTGPEIVIDGGGKVTLSGGGKHRILYQNTCDQAQKWTTSHCQNQDHPRLSIQNLTFVDGNATGETKEGGGGGAVFVRGGRVKIINSRFFSNVCDPTGPDLGGAAVRTLSQSDGLPVYVVNSTFGGKPGLGGSCSNGGGLSSIGVSYTVLNSLFTDNHAIGNGANPMKPGTPGGGSGGAIYNDGNTFTLTLCGVKMSGNTANEGGGAIFFVSNDKSGELVIQDSVLTGNPSAGFETKGYPGIFFLGKGTPQVTGSTLQ